MGAERMVIIDPDGQHDVAELLAGLQDGSDAVLPEGQYGSRACRCCCSWGAQSRRCQFRYNVERASTQNPVKHGVKALLKVMSGSIEPRVRAKKG